MKCVLAVDQGTTATKSYILDTEGRFTFRSSIEHRQIYPRPGWVEHDPEELLLNVKNSIDAAGDIEVLGIDNQGETVVAWDSVTGHPVYNAIVWQDRRTSDFIDRLKSEGAEELTLRVAGLPLDPYFSASKLRWILKNVPEARSLLKRNQLRLGTSESFFIYRLTGEYVTDVTTASRTSLMNLKTCTWDRDLCKLFEIPIEILPEVRPTTAQFGSVKSNGKYIPICASVVDQQAALMGHSCYETGQTKVTFGTGVFAMTNVGTTVLDHHESGILPTVAWQIAGGKPVYAVDAGVYNAGSAVNWVKSIGLFDNYAEIDRFKNPPSALRGLVFVPALSGLACPFWDRTAAGMWLGISLETTKEDLCQAVLEGIAFRTSQVLDAIGKLTGSPQKLSVDGGLTSNSYFCQFLADVTQCEVVIPAFPDITAYGTGRFALIGSGMIKQIHDLPSLKEPNRIILPHENLSYLKNRFNDAIERVRNWRQGTVID